MADEYISREAFKAEVWSLSTHYLNEWDTLGVLAAADRIPAADVAPVRHGRWNYHDSFALECSNCGWINYHNMGVPNSFNYCPNCGARMVTE